MTPLGRKLLAQIAEDGPLPLDAFVAACLTDPAHGYYRWASPIGRQGDFITAPEISQVFGELIGLWAAAVADGEGAAVPGAEPLTLVELGPGRGTLLADALRAIGRTQPALAAGLNLALVEINPALRQAQAAALAALPAGLPRLRSPVWYERFADIPPGRLIVIANEFFDALPLRQYVFADGAWRERRVARAACGEALLLVLGEDDAAAAIPAPLLARLGPPSEGMLIEVSPAAERLAGAIAGRIAAAGGAALIVDYGPARSAPGDTLQAVAGHRFADPLAAPGAADLSHHVDFEALAVAVTAAGAKAWGPLAQGLFLSRLGLAERGQRLTAAAPAAAREAIVAGCRRLVHPGRMGVLFKALAITPADRPPPPGFDGG